MTNVLQEEIIPKIDYNFVYREKVNMDIKKAITIIILLLTPVKVFAEYKLVPRVIIGLYDSKATPEIKGSRIHKFLEMPLNHLGLIVEYHDILQGMPNINNRDDVLGVISWYRKNTETNLTDKDEYAKWAISVINSGKKFIFLGNPGFGYSSDNGNLNDLIEKFFKLFGVYSTGQVFNHINGEKIFTPHKNLYNFEKTLTSISYEYPQLKIIGDKTHSLVDTQFPDSQTISSLSAISPNGGFVVQDYAINFLAVDEKNIYEWYINPFEFLRQALGLNLYPMPDTTTILGNRIFYSHIDGDGWNNVSRVDISKDLHKLDSEVIYDNVLKANPGLPVTVGPVAAEIDPKWVGNEQSIAIAKKILALPNIEAGSHTYSHPLYWKFFENYSAKKEQPFLGNYPSQLKSNIFEIIKNKFIKLWQDRKANKEKKLHDSTTDMSINPDEGFIGEGLQNQIIPDTPEEVMKGYDIPRSYAEEPFSLNKEIMGSKKYIEKYTPKDKKISVIQWSGDTTPFPKAVQQVYEDNLLNINGGDSRLDKDFNSYAWVAPLSVMVGNYRQIYSSNSNEYIYTNGFNGLYYSFAKLQETLKNTEHPFRLRPINLYYHMYSGEYDESLKALLDNIKYIKTQNIIPIKTSTYIKIVQGFFTAKIYKDPIALNWKIENRGELNTIRFDAGNDYFIDFKHSNGVLGFNHYQNSLYIFLDPKINNPNFSLTKTEDNAANYIKSSSWNIWDLKINNIDSWEFYTQGYGTGKITWHTPLKDAKYTISYGDKKISGKSKDYLLKFSIDNPIDNINNEAIKIMVNRYE